MKAVQPGQQSNGRVLGVDDEPKNRELLRDLLEVGGYAVREAEDGIAALAKAASGTCDVILLDVMMPRMDGLEACRQLKANPATAHIPVLMVTALVDSEERHQGIAAGANDYLAKPIDRRDVLLRVRNAICTKRLHDKVQERLTQLRELETLRDNLTHMIVHDMRVPLMCISGSHDMILTEKSRLSPMQQEFVAMGLKNCSALIEMVRSLLDVSRLESGQMPFHQEPCDLLQIAQKAALSVDLLAREKKLVIRTGGDAAGILVDRDIIYRVFVNLLGNAIKCAPEDSTIGVSVTAAGGTARAMVTDLGRGIPAEFHQKIFEKFGQVDSRAAGRIQSSGLGLAFCKLAVEAHGGRIGVESPSTPPKAGEAGKGSTFWFTIPLQGAIQ